jgi:hypothetical protein
MVTIRVEDAVKLAAAIEKWIPVIQQLFAMGVKSWDVIAAVLQDADADVATVQALRPKWADLVADIRRAAGESA